MDDKIKEYSNKSFKYSLLSIIFFTLNFCWVGFAIEILKLKGSIGGSISGIIMILFFIFNFLGARNYYKLFINNGSVDLIKKITIFGNLILLIIPGGLIFFVVLQLIGVDIVGVLSESIKN